MKKLFLATLFIFLAFSICAQKSEKTCHFGIHFEISNNSSWGYGEPVVLTVDPNSPAEAAGIKPGDIIMEINGSATYLRNYQTIYSWLFDDSADMAVFTIRNLDSYFKEIELPRRCRPVNVIDEANLASSFNMYSLEDTQDRIFTLPLKIVTNRDVDYSDYHTYDFMQEPGAPAVDRYVYGQLEQALKDKGLKRTQDNPDMYIQTYYSYQPNLKYNPMRKSAGVPKTSWRFDYANRKMVLLPLLSPENSDLEQEGQFILEFGIRFFDKKLIDPENLTQIWEASTKEYLSAQYTLEEYTKLHTPLVLTQFPYASNKSSVKFTVNLRRYNYTGLCFDINDMRVIGSVDFNSPAYKAGLRAGMVVEKINGIKFSKSRDEILDGYKRFIVGTMQYRDPNTLFTDANGYPDCMYWNTKDYSKIAAEFKKGMYYTMFSYLYSFERYVSDNPRKEMSVETKKMKYNVIPEIKKEINIKEL